MFGSCFGVTVTIGFGVGVGAGVGFGVGVGAGVGVVTPYATSWPGQPKKEVPFWTLSVSGKILNS